MNRRDFLKFVGLTGAVILLPRLTEADTIKPGGRDYFLGRLLQGDIDATKMRAVVHTTDGDYWLKVKGKVGCLDFEDLESRCVFTTAGATLVDEHNRELSKREWGCGQVTICNGDLLKIKWIVTLG